MSAARLITCSTGRAAPGQLDRACRCPSLPEAATAPTTNAPKPPTRRPWPSTANRSSSPSGKLRTAWPAFIICPPRLRRKIALWQPPIVRPDSPPTAIAPASLVTSKSWTPAETPSRPSAPTPNSPASASRPPSNSSRPWAAGGPSTNSSRRQALPTLDQQTKGPTTNNLQKYMNNNNTKKLADKVAVVTGASKGIGASIAKHLAAEGAAVVVNFASNKAGADEVVAEITANGGKAIAVQANVAKRVEIERLFAETKKTFGGLDILVNNAGVYEFSPLEAVTEEHFRKQFDLNVLGLILVTQAAVNLIGTVGGSIINISSLASKAAFPN